jgi:hypothetical protein
VRQEHAARPGRAKPVQGLPGLLTWQSRIHKHQGARVSGQPLQHRSEGFGFFDRRQGITGFQKHPQTVAQASGLGNDQYLINIFRHANILSKLGAFCNAKNFGFDLVKNFVNLP